MHSEASAGTAATLDEQRAASQGAACVDAPLTSAPSDAGGATHGCEKACSGCAPAASGPSVQRHADSSEELERPSSLEGGVEVDHPIIELINVLTMMTLPIVSATASVACGAKFWVGLWTSLAWAVSIPGSAANHFYAAMYCASSPFLMKLDRSTISLGCVMLSWPISRSPSFFGVAAAACAAFNAAAYLGPPRVQRSYWLLTIGCGGMLIYTLAGMTACWPQGPNPLFLPTLAAFSVGAFFMIVRPLGALSHPTWHLMLNVAAAFIGVHCHRLDVALGA